jgi:hypothetical protein
MKARPGAMRYMCVAREMIIFQHFPLEDIIVNLRINLKFAICILQFAFTGIIFTGIYTTAKGDEGMWLFNNPPNKILKQRYNFTAAPEWLDHVRLASVRFNAGGSASFVSGDGLVMTNHHVGADALQKLSSKEHDYLKNGFYAKTRAEELKCADQELNVLVSIEDVTAKVNAAVPAGLDMIAAEKARRAIMNTIEKESTDKTGLRSDVITLYNGGEYHLYRYKKYTDVRLVFAPEQDIAFFGGDPDNFEYPRFDLDISFFRVYEDGKPANIEQFLKWSKAGPKDDELVFVSGNPGKTDRLDTTAHLEFIRDRAMPDVLNRLRRREVLLSVYSERSAENARRAKDDLFGVANSRKARLGMLAGLQDPAVMQSHLAVEQEFRLTVMNNPQLKQSCGEAWSTVEDSIKVLSSIYTDLDVLEKAPIFQCQLMKIARTLVRLADETAKPNADRLREYRESNLESLKLELFADTPIYKDLETLVMADYFSYYLESKGASDALCKKVLAGMSPEQRAAALVQGTRLEDVAFRKKLAEGGRQAIEASTDPMIQLARLMDAPARAVREKYEQQVEEPQRQAYGQIAKARFALYGSDIYPDATFTLRLAFGIVKGYKQAGENIPPWTTMAGLYQRSGEHDNRPPFNLPQRWLEQKQKINLDTPFNFVSTVDIIGGNSGSPVFNRDAELVGIIFDGNLQSLVWDYVYSDVEGRAVAVHSSAIIEALQKVYNAKDLADELIKGRL